MLEDGKLIIPVKGGKYIINVLLAKHLKTRKSNKCVHFPVAFLGLSDAIIYKKVMAMCDLPLTRRGAGSSSYIIRTMTKEAVPVLKAILSSKDIDFTEFIAKTKEFYSSDTMVPGFAKYLTTNVWEEVYDNVEKASAAIRDRKGII